ncbi:MAG: 50S ribosomal protein L25 [Anaerolineae bacterium]
MDAIELKAETRQTTGKHVKQLRRQGYVPAVIYGNTPETSPIQIEAKTLNKVLAQAGTHQLIALQVDKKRPVMTLAREIQRDAIKRGYLHVDFYAVNMREKVTAEVPIVFEGVAPAVRDHAGTLVHGLTEVEIECLPADLISGVAVNIETLATFDDIITVADLKVPSTIAILTDPDTMVAKVEPPRVEEVLEEAAPTGAEPEVLTGAKERKEEEE